MTSPRSRLHRRAFCLGAAALAAGPRALGAEPRIALGAGAALGGFRPFPADDPWNRDVSRLPVDPASDALIRGIGADKPLHPDFGTTYGGMPNGIPYVVVPGSQPRAFVRFDYAGESDPGPYPIPDDVPIEGGPTAVDGDRHALILDRDNLALYELFALRRESGAWRAGSGAVFDLRANTARPDGWTSADAAGLPIFPGLARYDEAVGAGAIRHALRFTCARTRRAYVAPARHRASNDPSPGLPPMGMRVRLRGSFDARRFPAPARAVLEALKAFGMILADNGGDWFISGAPDPRWDDEALATLRRVRGRDFEVVRMGRVVVD